MENSEIIKAFLEQEKKTLAIQNNIEKALEEIPESLTHVNMLYIPAKINGVELKLFIDTGAQVSVMPLKIAQELGLEEILDYQCQGIVKGVGEQQIIGKIHFVELEISDFFMGCSFTVIAEQKDIILGLDMLYSHSIVINLKERFIDLSGKKINFC